ncbi:reverse transcriptase domain-containing protein [Enterobacter ludwigii]
MDEQWDKAWPWHTRRNAPANADIRDLRFYWKQEERRIWASVKAGTYRFSPMRVFRTRGGDGVAQWSARDALVLKYVALNIEGKLPVHEKCAHHKGHGGVSASVRNVQENILTGNFPFVFRTDIQGYYRHIVKAQLWRQVNRHVADTSLAGLIRQYLWYSCEDAGEFFTPQTGIPGGCALSPLSGASLLYHVDCGFNAIEDICYARYMDDFLVLAPTRWRLRQCVRQLNTYFEMHAFRSHPDKTFIGRVSRGFDWLGVDFNDHGATDISARAREHHHERCQRLYEQSLRRGMDTETALVRVQDYRKRWSEYNRILTKDTKMHEMGARKAQLNPSAVAGGTTTSPYYLRTLAIRIATTTKRCWYITLCLFHATCHGALTGETSVRSSVVVGAAASCTADISTTSLPNKIFTSGGSRVTVGTLVVSCPGAGNTYAGLVGGDGRTGYRSDDWDSSSVGAPVWHLSITSQRKSLGLVIATSGSVHTYTVNPNDGLDPSVVSLATQIGSTGTYTIQLSRSDSSLESVQLNTGAYPYTAKAFGWWN